MFQVERGTRVTSLVRGSHQSDEVESVERRGASPSLRRGLRTAYFGSANATYASPLFVPILPPPQAMTTYCRPFTE